MTTAPLTYMVADIVGSSRIMLNDNRREFDLYETFQSILVPIIEKAVGFGIEFTGDAVSASFRSCKSAVKTGFAIQQALETWNLSSAGTEITARIGIHSSKSGEDENLQQLSLAGASRLQSLGRADALCVSRNIIDEISIDSPVHAYQMGRHDLGFLRDTVPVFYLYEEKQAFLRRQGFLLEYLKTEYLDKIKSSIIPPVIEIPLLAIATVLFLAFTTLNPAAKTKEIDITEVRNLNIEFVSRELRDMVSRIQARIQSKTDRFQRNIDGESVLKLVLSLQENKDQIRVSWGIFKQSEATQVSGGVETGNKSDLADLERKTIENIFIGLSL